MNKAESIRTKWMKLDDLKRQIAVWRMYGRTVIFTNGCFDVLHPGHFHLLNSAASLSDKPALIVGVNEDESVARLKGPKRPVHNFEDRVLSLASLYAVDAVIGFSTDTPAELIEELKPDILVKGGDYKPEDIVGADTVIAAGGRVEVLPYIEGHSTTSILNKN